MMTIYLGFERDFLKFLSRLEEDNQRRIRKNKEKLKTNEEYGQVCCFIFKCIALKVYYMKIDKNYQFTQLFLQKKEDERKQRSTMEIVGLDEEIKKCFCVFRHSVKGVEYLHFQLRLNFYSCSLSRALAAINEVLFSFLSAFAYLLVLIRNVMFNFQRISGMVSVNDDPAVKIMEILKYNIGKIIGTNI
uniref:Uncharacterized protein n=1 Tax=Heterorhabditis bacteriophora TaxID=37862 RepID=A0A1I7WBG6_HETBA